LLEAISKTLDCVLLKEHSQIIVHSDPAALWRENAEGIPWGESMTMTHLECAMLRPALRRDSA
jgi:hypothetical protein